MTLYLNVLLHLKEPTAIQKQAVPTILSGRDVLATSDTGSGKTLAYLIPMATFLSTQPPTHPGDGPLVVILAPTRELVQQIYVEANRLLAPWHIFTHLLQYPSAGGAATLGVNATAVVGTPIPTIPSPSSIPCRKVLGVVGGLSVGPQMAALKSGVDVLVATPGRLLDLQARNAFSVQRIRYLVLDEIDRMLEQRLKEPMPRAADTEPRPAAMHGSMEDQLRRFIAQCSISERQTLLFSATMPQSVVRLARSAVLDPIVIKVGSRHPESSAAGNSSIPRTIKQHVLFVQSSMKPAKLLDVLRKTPAPPVIVFCDHISTVDKIVDQLREEQFHVAGLHSDKTQEYRFQVVNAMRNGRLDVLVATDLASRGLDFTDVTHVIQYDLPDTIEDYIHRVGRTGRAGRQGHATALLTYSCKIAGPLKVLLKENEEQQIPKELELNFHMFGQKVVQTEFGDKVIYD